MATKSTAIATGSSTGSNVNFAGDTPQRVQITGAWPATTDLTFETSVDGKTWTPLYNDAGAIVRVVAPVVNRTYNLPANSMNKIGRLRPRMGTVGAYVNATATATIVFIS